jgi:predicted transcriptional regulator
MSAMKDLGEQDGILELLLILLKNGKLSKAEVVSALGRSSTTAYRCLAMLKKLDLITELEPTSFPYRKDVSLTEKGRRVAELLVQVEKILTEGEK